MSLVVALEGLPATGKTTVIEALTHELTDRGRKVKTFDIETTGHALKLRAIARTYPLGHPSRIMIFWILRLQQYEAIQEEVVKSEVDVIFADRYWGSTIAFDVYGNSVPPYVLEWIGRCIQKGPDLTLYLKAPIEVVRNRKIANTMASDIFAAKVTQGYDDMAKKHGWVEVDATESSEDVMYHCLELISHELINR